MSESIDHGESNRQFFDNLAHKYDDLPFATELTEKIGNAVRKDYAFDANATVMMEYACGTGLVSRQLAPYAKTIVGVDISQGMVDQFNLRVSNQGIPPEEMRAVRQELKGEEGELDSMRFDVIVCAQAYHHFSSIEDTTRILAFFLKPGGALIVLDLIKTDDDPHEAMKQVIEKALQGDIAHVHHTHGHAAPGTDDTASAHGQVTAQRPAPNHDHIVAHKGGFEEHEIKKVFDSANLEQFSFRPAVRVSIGDSKTLNLFLAKGIKAN